jgi:hypothetical protein
MSVFYKGWPPEGALPSSVGGAKSPLPSTRQPFLKDIAPQRVTIALTDPRGTLIFEALRLQKEKERSFADILKEKRRRDAKNPEIQERLARYRENHQDPSVETFEDLAKKAPYFPDGKPYYGSKPHQSFAKAMVERMPWLKDGVRTEQEALQRAMLLAPFGGSGVAINSELDKEATVTQAGLTLTGAELMTQLGIYARRRRRSDPHHMFSHLENVLDNRARAALIALEIDQLAGTLYGVGPLKELHALCEEPHIERIGMGTALLLTDETISSPTRQRVIAAFGSLEAIPDYKNDLQSNGWNFQEA